MMTLLRRQRIACGMTLAQFARACRVTPPAALAWECGRALPSPKRIQTVATVLQLNPLELLNIMDPPRTLAAVGQ